MTTSSFSHVSATGESQMVDVSQKHITLRQATARGSVIFSTEIYAALKATSGQTKKGSIIETARIAGIMAAKRTWELIPLCHPLMIEKCDVQLHYADDACAIHIESTVAVQHKTGVEMEALTAVSVAALTLYDMCKAISHDMRITDIALVHKSGGKRNV